MAVISAAEAALFSLTGEQVDKFRESSDRREKTIADLLSNPRFLLTALNSMKYFMLMGIAILFTWSALAYPNGFTALELFLSVLIISVVVALFGVILPKIYGAAHNTGTARTLSMLCKWVVTFLRGLVNPLQKMSFKVEQKLEEASERSAGEAHKQTLKLSAPANLTTARDEVILEGIVTFGTLTARDVMTPHNEISWADASLNFHELLDFVRKSGYSRIPVCRNTPDKIEGILYIKDLLPFLDENIHFDWHKLLRPVYFIPATKKIDRLLKDFQEKRVHMAIVASESGITLGLVTLEDVIEEIIGEINDEFDEVTQAPHHFHYAERRRAESK